MVEVDGLPPSNSQLQFVAFSLDWSVNCTVSGAQPSVTSAVKPAVGAVATTTVWVNSSDPQALVAVRMTVYSPSWA